MADDCGRRREQLRPWLERLLNENTVDGVRWINTEKTKFQIPWYHHNKPGWSCEKGQIFKEWAKHTGRYRDGVDDEDWSRWKTRLRCALNKAPDIVEIKNSSEQNVDEMHPCKVYELRPRTEENEGLPSDLASISPDELLQVDQSQITSGLSDMSIDDFAGILSENDHTMIFRLCYCRREVYSKVISKENGCWLHYGRDMVCTGDIDDIWLPPCDGLMPNKVMEKEVQNVIERGMRNGFHFRIVNNNIVVSRFCKCTIYYTSLLGTHGSPIKLRRCNDTPDVDGNVEIFNYANCFVPAIEQYTMGIDSSLIPDPWVYVMIGSKKPLSELDESVPVYAQITTQRAFNEYSVAIETKKKSISNSVENMSCDSLELPDYDCTRKLMCLVENMDDIIDDFFRPLEPAADDLTSRGLTTDDRPILTNSIDFSDIFDSSILE